MFATMKSSIPLLAAVLAGSADAFWRINCANVQMGRIDPLVSPGGVAAHVHTLQGAASKFTV